MSDFYEGFAFKDYGDHSILPWVSGGKLAFELDVEYIDGNYGPDSLTLDALEVYKNLKEYFKGTKYE